MNNNDKDSELVDAFYRAVNTVTRGHVITDGKIVSVDEVAFTCSVSIGESTNPATYYNVPLRVLKNQQASIIEIPKVGTNCIICFIQGNLGRPKLYEIHESESIFINCNSIIYHGGNLGGMVKVDDLVVKLNAIEQDLNNLKTIFSTWAPIPNDGGAALKSTASNWYGQQLKTTQKSDLENTKIKQ